MMDTHAHSVSALAESANEYTSVDDTAILVAAEMGEADEEIGESRMGTVKKKAWGFWKVVWIAGAVFVGTVIAALVFEWSSAAKSSDPHFVTQLEFKTTPKIIDGEALILKSIRSSAYLYVSTVSMGNGDPVFHRDCPDNQTTGFQWQVEYVGGTMVMLKNRRSGFYLHVADQKKSNGDPVFQRNSTTDGSKWHVEYIVPFGSMIRLKNVRSGFYLHVAYENKSSGNPVFQRASTSNGSTWEFKGAL